MPEKPPTEKAEGEDTPSALTELLSCKGDSLVLDTPAHQQKLSSSQKGLLEQKSKLVPAH